MGLDGLALLGLSGVYMAFLMAVAWRSERQSAKARPSQRRLIYGLSLAVYCTSWTFFGAVGTAVRSGWDCSRSADGESSRSSSGNYSRSQPISTRSPFPRWDRCSATAQW